jgi:hypothetical protein
VNDGPPSRLTIDARSIYRYLKGLQLLWGSAFGFYIYIYALTIDRALGGATSGPRTQGIALWLMALRQGANAILDIPSGSLADTFGRIRMVRLGFVAWTVFHLSLAMLSRLDTSKYATILGVLASLA